MINTRLFATVLERLVLFPIKTALWLKILSRLLEVNFQINYSTVLPGFDLLQMANDCDEYISTKNRLSDILSNEPPLKCPSSAGGGIHIRSFFFPSCFLFINLVISLFAYLFILIFIHFFFLQGSNKISSSSGIKINLSTRKSHHVSYSMKYEEFLFSSTCQPFLFARL